MEVTESHRLMMDMMVNTTALTQRERVPHVLIALKRDPQMLFIVAEVWLAVMTEPYEVLHSGRAPLEV